MTRIYKTYICILSILLLAAIAVGQFNAVPTASAVVVTENNFDKTKVEDDLADVNFANYPKDENGTPQIFEVIEYCYSDNVFRQSNYGLYIYVYNPAQTCLLYTSPSPRD